MQERYAIAVINKLRITIALTSSIPGEPQERFLEVVVGLGRDVVVLQVLLAMEDDRFGCWFNETYLCLEAFKIIDTHKLKVNLLLRKI